MIPAFKKLKYLDWAYDDFKFWFSWFIQIFQRSFVKQTRGADTALVVLMKH